MIIEIEAEYQSDAGTTKDTPYLALTGELWGVFCEYLWENQPRYNGTALYLHFVSFLHIDMTQVVDILPQVRQEPTYST